MKINCEISIIYTHSTYCTVGTANATWLVFSTYRTPFQNRSYGSPQYSTAMHRHRAPLPWKCLWKIGQAHYFDDLQKPTVTRHKRATRVCTSAKRNEIIPQAWTVRSFCGQKEIFPLQVRSLKARFGTTWSSRGKCFLVLESGRPN